MSEEIVKAVGFLRKNGGYSLTVTPQENGYVVTGYFKDIGSYGTSVSYAAVGETIEAAQNGCISELAKLVYYTNGSKPAKDKPAPSAPTGSAIVSLKGLQDDQWNKAKDIVKGAGFKFDKDSKNWVGGDVNSLPDWLKKRTKGGSNGSYSNGAAKTFYKKKEPEPQVEEDSSNEGDETASFMETDEMPF